MADVLLNARSFTKPYLEINGSYRIPVPLRTYLRAALTVGFQNGFAARGADRAIRKYHLKSGDGLFGFFREIDGGLCLQPSYHVVESTEKGTLTFRHASILAKIVAERHLNIPWLANVDEMRRQGYLTTSEATNERGDYVGLDLAHAWHAIEAKGRSDGVTDKLIQKAKGQAARITAVNGVAPATHSACIADLSVCPVTVTLVDPPSGGASPKNLQIPTAAFARFYYGGLVRYLLQHSESVRVDGLPNYVWAPVRKIYVALPLEVRASDLYIGMPRELLEAAELALDLRVVYQTATSPYVGLDYIGLAGRMPDWAQ